MFSTARAAHWRRILTHEKIARCLCQRLLLLAIPLLVTACNGNSLDGTPVALPTEATAQMATAVVQDITQIVQTVVTATPAPAVACAPATLEAATSVGLGALLPLSQSTAWPRGLALQIGLNLAVDEINAQGGIAGKPIQLITYDTMGDAQRSVGLAERLITQDCVVGLVGLYHDRVAGAVKNVAVRFGTPVIVVEAADEALLNDLPAELFRIGPTSEMLARFPAEWLTALGDFNKDGVTTAAILAENSPSGDRMVEQAERTFPAANISLLTVRVDLPAGDFSSQIARLVALNERPDALFLYLSGDASLGALRQLLDAGIGPEKGTLLVSNGAALDDRFWEQVPDGAGTVVYRRGPWPSTIDAAGRQLAERYAQLYTGWPEPAVFTGYDAARLLLDAVSRADSLAGPALIGALERTDLLLSAGHYTFPVNAGAPPDGEATFDWQWHQWLTPPVFFLQYDSPGQNRDDITVIWSMGR
jgi:branched-chain amino acid transport system substrate-binding protein